MNNKEITLTLKELEDIKDTAKFREMVIITLKQLKGIPHKVTKLEVHSAIHWALIILVLSGVIGLAWRVLAR